MSQSSTTPIILALSLGDTWQQSIFRDVHGSLINKLAQKSELKQAGSTQEALDLIKGNNDHRAILVADPGITTTRNGIVSDEIVEFTRNGGTVVLGGAFSTTIRPPDLNKYFDSKWGLPWKAGSYHRTTVALNHLADGVPRGNLPSSYSQKAVFLDNVDGKAALYLPTENSVTESFVFPPMPIANRSETPVAFMRVGKGWLRYIGDVNGEKDTDTVVLGMLGMLGLL